MAAKVSRASQAIVHKNQPQLYVKGKWQFIQTKDLTVFKDTASEIVKNQDEILRDRTPSEIIDYIKQFNAAWTTECIAQKVISGPSKKDCGPIQFSSVDKKSSWLSNFFQTLIYDPDHKRILPHVEAGYVAYKITSYEKKNPLVSTVITVMDPKEAKRLGENWKRSKGKLPINEMKRLSTLKYEQNPVLSQMLQSTGERPLKEHTRDPFWGTAYNSAIGKNHLGKILTEVRPTIGIRARPSR